MASHAQPLGLALALTALWLVGASGAASLEPLACDGSHTACFDLATIGANITHVFVDSGCGADPSDFFITVDGDIVTELHTDDGPCESVPREGWFPLQSHQERVQVCLTVQDASLEGLRVYG